jgi:hypothetical protein
MPKLSLVRFLGHYALTDVDITSDGNSGLIWFQLTCHWDPGVLS